MPVCFLSWLNSYSYTSFHTSSSNHSRIISLPASCSHVARHPFPKSGHLSAQSNGASWNNSTISHGFMFFILSILFMFLLSLPRQSQRGSTNGFCRDTIATGKYIYVMPLGALPQFFTVRNAYFFWFHSTVTGALQVSHAASKILSCISVKYFVQRPHSHAAYTLFSFPLI